MKFNHNFKLVDYTDNYRLYACDDVNARLDFVEENIVRVAIYRHGEDILPKSLRSAKLSGKEQA